MNKICLPIDSYGHVELENVGGKAANLNRLMKGGFKVPEGFIITVAAYEDFISKNGLENNINKILENSSHYGDGGARTCSEKIKEAIMAARIDDLLIEEVRSYLDIASKDALWAVRSSAVAEDLPEASFAGQQDTFLNVSPDDVMASVKMCWASYWNERALAYRQNTSISHLEGGVAVVVQRMVDSSTSGVMFTKDPVYASSNNMIIESSWGLGESIVSGIVSPDRFVYDPMKNKVIESRISRKDKGLFLSKNTIVEIEDKLQKAPSISDLQMMQLLEIGKRIEDYFEHPQDIEWSIEGDSIYILQSRPITTLDSDEEVLWTRAYGDEYWADVTSPLFFSFLGHYLTNYVNHEGSSVMGYKELTGLKLLKLHKGHIYFNSKVLEEVFTFNPRFSRTKELLNYFPVKDQERIANAKTKTLRRIWAEIRIMLKDPDGSMMRTDKAYRKWADEYLRAMRAYDELDLTAISDKELHEQYVYMENAFLKHFRLIRYGMVTHSIGTNLMIKRWLIDWLDDRTGELYSKLISGLPDNKTIVTNMSMARLANKIRLNEELSEVLKNGDEKEFLDKLRAYPEYRDYNEFMEKYGQRSHTRELLSPRWVEDQRLVIDILRSLVTSSPIDFEKIEKDKSRERIETEKMIYERIGRLPMGFVKKTLFKIVLRYAQIYLIFRENQRFYLDHILYRVRRLFLEYGRRFKENGLIENEEDIFFLSKEEIFSISLGGSRSPLIQIASRKKEFEDNKYTLPPKFLRGRIEFDDTVMYDDDVVKITGTSASPGIVTGRVRVVESIDQLPLVQENEILITSNTDPGWTPVFAKLGGLVTETGGILSHGAVVSREYGIPAVTAVKNATSFFKDGQKITLDGNDGIIYLKE